MRYFTLAFITARNTCEASWGGVVALSDNLMLTDVTTLRSQGGDVIVSFGAANGIEFGQSCTSVTFLQAEYQTVIDKYSLTRIDFDIEGGAIADAVSIDRRNKAIAGLQATARANGKTLIVQYTLPVMRFGLTNDGDMLLRNSIQIKTESISARQTSWQWITTAHTRAGHRRWGKTSGDTSFKPII